MSLFVQRLFITNISRHADHIFKCDSSVLLVISYGIAVVFQGECDPQIHREWKFDWVDDERAVGLFMARCIDKGYTQD